MSDTPSDSPGQALPEAVTSLYTTWHNSGEDQHLTLLVRALFETLEVSDYDNIYASKGDSAVILEDLGIDSLTMAEMLFYTEDLMGILEVAGLKHVP